MKFKVEAWWGYRVVDNDNVTLGFVSRTPKGWRSFYELSHYGAVHHLEDLVPKGDAACHAVSVTDGVLAAHEIQNLTWQFSVFVGHLSKTRRTAAARLAAREPYELTSGTLFRPT